MPKKYKQKSLLTKPSSSTPSYLSLSKGSDSQNEPSKKTVNDLLRESRRGTGNERPLAVHSTSSIPPALRAVLDVPIPPPPVPRCGVRGPTRLRRIPGPPPPRSWLEDSTHASRKVKDVKWSKSHEITRIQQSNSILPESSFPDSRSLQHLVLRKMASNWLLHAQYDHEYLAELPSKLKQDLLSYIAIYSDGQGPNPLRLLFPAGIEREDLDEVRRLDLGNAIGHWLSLKKFEKYLEDDRTIPRRTSTLLSSTPNTVPNDWDDEDNTERPNVLMFSHDGGMRFRNLKHISLSLTPGTAAFKSSWADLLSLATKLSTVTSLSLAYWPQPTYTPNASGRMAKIQTSNPGSGPSVTYGGSNFYTAFDNDWREAAGILRALSKSLYCLTWLDLTGCSEWLPALTWSQLDDNEGASSGSIGPDWNGSWREIQRLILAVGWDPGPPPKEVARYLTTHAPAADLVSSYGEDAADRISNALSRLESTRIGSLTPEENTTAESWNVEYEREKYYHRMEVVRHKELDSRARAVSQELRAIRRRHGGRWINVEHD